MAKAISAEDTAPARHDGWSKGARDTNSRQIADTFVNMGPLRFDLAKLLRSQPGEDRKLFTFTVGTVF